MERNESKHNDIRMDYRRIIARVKEKIIALCKAKIFNYKHLKNVKRFSRELGVVFLMPNPKFEYIVRWKNLGHNIIKINMDESCRVAMVMEAFSKIIKVIWFWLLLPLSLGAWFSLLSSKHLILCFLFAFKNGFSKFGSKWMLAALSVLWFALKGEMLRSIICLKIPRNYSLR